MGIRVLFLRRHCFLKYVIEETIEGMKTRGRRRKQLQDDLKAKKKYWNLKRKSQMTLCGKFVLIETLNLSQDKLSNERFG
jgi:hypothetical protein